jgi:hypothetical protein
MAKKESKVIAVTSKNPKVSKTQGIVRVIARSAKTGKFVAKKARGTRITKAKGGTSSTGARKTKK